MNHPLRLLALLVLLLPATFALAQKSPAKIKLSAILEPAGAGQEMAIDVSIPPGFHAQSDKPLTKNLRAFVVRPVQTEGVTFGTPAYPPGHIEVYPVIGQQSVYSGDVRVTLPVTLAPDAKVDAISADVLYQVCDDQGQCFFPETKRVTVSLSGTPPPPGDAVSTTAPATVPANAPADTIASTPASISLVKPPSQPVWLALLTALVAGLIFNVMPCVLPVLPLKAIGFYEVANHKRSKSFLLGLIFTAGMVSVFAALGIAIFPLTLFQWGELFAHGWFAWPMVALLALMALGLMGLFDINLPTSAYRFAPRHDTYGGNFAWGALTAILATPCTAPLLPPLLLWAAQQPSAVAVLSMVFVGIGMALPYLILSTMPEVARRFPRSGPWAALFKQMMGFMVLAAATYFGAGRLMHAPYFYIPVLVVIVVAAGYLMVRTVQLSPKPRPILISGIIALFLVGSSGYWTLLMTRNAHEWTSYTKSDFDTARGKQIVLVKFTANWCQTCQWIEGNVYTQASVWRTLNGLNVHAVKADLSDLTDDPQFDPRPLLTQLNPAGGIPLTAIFAPGRRDPIVLSSIYSEKELLSALAGLSAQASR